MAGSYRIPVISSQESLRIPSEVGPRDFTPRCLVSPAGLRAYRSGGVPRLAARNPRHLQFHNLDFCATHPSY